MSRPILFSGPLVRAILSGQKTVTRRLVTVGTSTVYGIVGERMPWPVHCLVAHGASTLCSPGEKTYVSARIFPEAKLWVREMYRAPKRLDDRKPSEIPMGSPVLYEADEQVIGGDPGGPWGKGRPSIFMPRWASRITLLVNDVRAERLQDITGSDVLAEGIGSPGEGEQWEDDQRVCFARVWNELNDHRASWGANPWLWVVRFSVQEIRS